MIGRNDDCWCGSGKKWKKCHFPQEAKADTLKDFYQKKYNITLKTEAQIQGIRAACHLASSILEETCQRAREGVTTLELNDFANKLHQQAGAIPAPLNYGQPPFPKSICTSLNNVICHGIPDSVPLKKGDILNIDVTSILNGFYGDCSKMVVIGETTTQRQLVVDVAYQCLLRGLAVCSPDVEIREIGYAITNYAKSQGCSVVYQFVGHGVGLHFHEQPQIPHCLNEVKIPMAPGMIFTIEPMINAGLPDAVIDPDDHWTARTKDGKASAQFEHTVLITADGHEILTHWNK